LQAIGINVATISPKKQFFLLLLGPKKREFIIKFYVLKNNCHILAMYHPKIMTNPSPLGLKVLSFKFHVPNL
jgi:hypothetical protein